MKQYKVLKEMINAPVGTILDNNFRALCLNNTTTFIMTEDYIKDAIDQGFIEPYTPEPKRWRAGNSETFLVVVSCEAVLMSDDRAGCDNRYYNSGNYFKSQATAELVAKARKLELEWLHEPYNDNDNPVKSIRNNDFMAITSAMDEARKACLEDDSNE